MQVHEFYEDDPDAPADGWGADPQLDIDLLNRLARGPAPGGDDLATAIALTRETHHQFEQFGTSGGQRWNTEQSRVALRALRLTLERHGIQLNVPWRDFDGFYSHWIEQDCKGSWKKRRDLLSTYFAPVTEALEHIEEDQFRAELAEGISPRPVTGWARVDEEISQLRLRFRSASTVQDYKDAGNRCVGVLEALSATVYDPARHCPAGATEPPVDKTDVRIGAYIEDRLPGHAHEELRGLVKKTSAFAHKVKHSPKADRLSAGLAGDAVIMLAQLLRRLAE